MRFYCPNIDAKLLEDHEKKVEAKNKIKRAKKDEEKALRGDKDNE